MTTVAHTLRPVKYRARRLVEERMVANGLAKTVEYAHQVLLRAHQIMGPLGRSFVEAGAGERALAFLRPFEDALTRVPVMPMADADVVEEEADGDEDRLRAIYRRDRTPANRAAWRKAAVRHQVWLDRLLHADEASA